MNAAARILLVTATFSLLFCEPVSAQADTSSVDPQLRTSSSDSGQSSAPMAQDAGWHFNLSPYLWFAGAHGTVGFRGRNVSMHATPGDLLSHFDIGVMGAAEARYKRLLLNGDLMWIRLSDSKALPGNRLGATSADVRVGEFVWTSKVGYRVLDHKRVKADANVGARYWHLGQKLNFNPSRLGLNATASQSWADIVVGGRIRLPAGEKVQLALLGDVGGWNATAKLDYQFAALAGYKLKPKWTLWTGYRYLFVDYRGSQSTVYNVVTSGALIGVEYQIR
jgi:hypothetical protein